MSLHIRQYGDHAVLADVDAAQVPALTDALHRLVALQGPSGGIEETIPTVGAASAHRTDWVVDIVPAACSVLVEFEPAPGRADRAAQLLRAAYDRPRDGQVGEGAPTLTLDCHYDGTDLAAVAAEIGESLESVIGRHSDGDYVVQFCGFSPGFGYLSGLDPVLHLPRLAAPRASVPAGSVAIAGEFTGVYPRSSPGGWRLLGHSDAVLFDVDRSPPALLSPGRRVRFRPA